MNRQAPAAACDWLADHLGALVWIVLALWTPPVAFSIMVDLHLAGGVGSGYPGLHDPGLLLDVMQIVLMASALPLLHRDRALAWRLLCGALGVWFLHDAWSIQAQLRLIGRHALLSHEMLLAAAPAVAALVLFAVRDHVKIAAPIARPTTDQQPAGLRLDTM
jgi:hypothetical protein